MQRSSSNLQKNVEKIYRSSKYKSLKAIIELIHKTSTTLFTKDIAAFVNSLLNTEYSVHFLKEKL